MIKLEKKINKNQLEDFHYHVILLIFKWLELSPKVLISYTKDIKNNPLFSTEEKKILKLIFRKTLLKKHLNHILNEINNSTNKNILSKVKYIYSYQRKKLTNGAHYIKSFSIPESFKILFIDFFFDQLFNDKELWLLISNQYFSKQIFISNFNLNTCPYCNIESIHRSRNYKIDHFLPKSIYPLLSMYYINLIPICEACNSIDSGKGDRILRPIYNQFHKEIGNYIDFDYHLPKKQILLSSSQKEFNNFIDLLKLNSAYSSEHVFNFMISEIKSLFTIIQHIPINKRDFLLDFISHSNTKNIFYLKKSYINRYYQSDSIFYIYELISILKLLK